MEFLKNETLVKAFEFSLINLIPKKHANEISQYYYVTSYMQERIETLYTRNWMTSSGYW